jgi:hypothetical protein
MSGQPLNKPSDAQKYRSAYLNTLALESKNNSKNLNANQVYKQTGQPAVPADTRTTTEKLSDVARLRVEVLNDLLKITDGQQANQIVYSLADSEIQYVAQNMPTILKDVSARFAKGITAGIFIPMVRSLINQAVVFSGVQYGLRNISGNGLTGNIGTFISSALTPIQYDLLLEALRGNSQAVRAISVIRNTFQQLPQINQKISGLPLQFIGPIIDALGDSFQDVPSRTQVDEYLRQLRVGGQPSAEARRDLGQIFIDAADTMEQNKPRLSAMMDEVNAIMTGQMGSAREGIETFEGDESLAPNSRKTGGGSSKSNTGGFDVPDFEFGVSSEIARDLDLPQAPPAQRVAGLPNSVEALRFLNKGELLRLVSDTLTEEQRAQIQHPAWSQSALIPKAKATKVDLIEMLTPFVMNPIVAQNEIKEVEEQPEGSGMRRMRGSGLKSRRPKTDGKVRVERQPNWTQMGDKLIHTAKLQNNILSMRCNSGRNVEGLPVQHISHKLGSCLRKIVGGAMPDYDDIQILTEDERDKLARIGSISKINSKMNIPKKTKEQQEMLEFDVLRGQVLAGNDNKGLLKRFKLMLIKFGDEGKLPQREVRDVLMTLASQGL